MDLKNKFLSIILFISFFSYADSSLWWIYFSDKSCSNKIALSQKSIEKRNKKNIPFDFHDISVCEDYIDEIKKYGADVRFVSRWLNAISVEVDSETILEIIGMLDFVHKIEPLKKKSRIKFKENDFWDNYKSSFSKRKSSIYGPSFNQIEMIGGVQLHENGYFGDNISVAVFDAGFTGVDILPVFNNLWDNYKIIFTHDLINNNQNVFDYSQHGTMVLSVMGGYMVDSLIGSAPMANYLLFRTEDSESETIVEEDYWAAAAELADSIGVDIINSSLGYTIMYDDTINSHTYSDMDGNTTIITKAADRAASRGILVVNSAGNSGLNSWYYIGAPADGDSVLAVGAVDYLGNIAPFSSRGPSFDGRIKPNVCAKGMSVVVADQDSSIRYANGTSFSAPLVSGLSACLWQAILSNNIDVSNMDIISLIQESSSLFSNPNDSLGYGIPNFYLSFLNSSIDSPNYESQINIFPNPFDNLFHLNGCFEENTQINFYDLNGKLVYSKAVIQTTDFIVVDDFDKFRPGLYLLNYKDYNQIIIKK